MVVLVLALLLAAPTVASSAPSPPCPGVRFLAIGPPAPPLDFLRVDPDGSVAFTDACLPAPGRATRSRGGSVIRARWKVCGGLAHVSLAAKLDAPACTTATGTLRAARMRLIHFTASPSTCGDGRLDRGGGEECDGGFACPAGAHCSAACACVADGATTTTTPPGPTTTTTVPPGGLFEASNPWNTDVHALPKDPASDGIIEALAGAGGWGTGAMRIDFSIEVLTADAGTPFRVFAENSVYYTPDCDPPFPFPVPPGGAIEGQPGYACDASANDCHLLVVHPPTKKLYEMYGASIVGSSFTGTCGVVWDLTKAYPPSLRGEQCTSADAGGFPIAAMVFSADEVAAGDIPHAIRFILPNSRMRRGVYVHPASHAGAPSGGPSLPPYGVRFRLRSDFPLASLPSDGARVVARAMQRYGMLLADGGNIALTAQSDRFTTHKWSDVGIDSHSLTGIQVTDMEVVALGPTVPLTYDCVRNP